MVVSEVMITGGWKMVKTVFDFYVDGFRRMTLGRTLWKIIFVKLFVMFAVLKLFFFPNFLNTHFETDQQRSDHVIGQLTQHVKK